MPRGCSSELLLNGPGGPGRGRPLFRDVRMSSVALSDAGNRPLPRLGTGSAASRWTGACSRLARGLAVVLVAAAAGRPRTLHGPSSAGVVRDHTGWLVRTAPRSQRLNARVGLVRASPSGVAAVAWHNRRQPRPAGHGRSSGTAAPDHRSLPPHPLPGDNRLDPVRHLMPFPNKRLRCPGWTKAATAVGRARVHQPPPASSGGRSACGSDLPPSS
jgi:hypothetical protein